MNKETLTKLLLSKDDTNILIALELLVGKTKAEVRSIFDVQHTNSNTLIKNIAINPHRNRRSYQISDDCIIYLGHNVSIAIEKHYNHIDLRSNYEQRDNS